MARYLDEFPWGPDLNGLHLGRGLGLDAVGGQGGLQSGTLCNEGHLDDQVLGGCLSTRVATTLSAKFTH